jgi:hypothetical protein
MKQKNPFTITEENKTILVGVISVITALFAIFYLIPNIFVSLFNTLLGNILMLLIVILVASRDFKSGIILLIIFTVILVTNHKISKQEGFWTEDSKQKFTELQQTVNPNLVFDLNRVQEQASQEEVDYYLQNGQWPWTQEVKDLYLEAINKNVLVRTYPEDSLNNAMKIYNQKIILEILSSQAKEGQFLLNGVIVESDKKRERDGAGSYGVNSGLETNSKSSTLIKCSSMNGVPEIIKYTGDEGILGSHTYDTKEITDYSTLETLIPGFKFLDGKPCNPCSSSKSCQFSFQGDVSNVWKYLWSQ